MTISQPRLKKTAAVSQSLSLETARRVLLTESQALADLAQTLGSDFERAIDMVEAVEGRVIVTGMGKSGHVARKIAATLASTGTPAFFVHPGEASHGDMGMIVRGDVILALSNSGEVKELLDIISYSRRFAIPLIGMTGRKESTLGTKADIALVLPPAPEACPNGLAPTTSTTMMLALGDALAITLLERRGFTAKDFQTFHPGGKLGQQLMRVCDIMHKGNEMPLCRDDVSVTQALAAITKGGFGCVGLINADGKLSGIITDGDIRRHMSADILSKIARDIMTASPRTIAVDALVGEAMGIMNDVKNTGRKITTLFVINDDQTPAGLLHIHDCLKAGFA